MSHFICQVSSKPAPPPTMNPAVFVRNSDWSADHGHAAAET